MNIIQVLLLGVIQGVAEFLPISSSGHLVLGRYFLGVDLAADSALVLDILLHAGSLLAIVAVYRKQWLAMLQGCLQGSKQSWQQVLLLGVATVPAVIIGLLFKDQFEAMFTSVAAVAAALIVTGSILLLSEKITFKKYEHNTAIKAVLIGLAQAAAIIPGISRSGSTIATGRLLKMEKNAAVDFSFMMAVPVIAGAAILTLKDVISAPSSTLLPYSFLLVGFISSLIASLWAIQFLRKWVQKRGLHVFAYYVIALGLLTLVLVQS
jgi:undecaprenyl-diphosphatase